MVYFSSDLLLKHSLIILAQYRLAINARRHRQQLPGFTSNRSWGLRFNAGDILKYALEKGPFTFFFEGICLSVRSRRFGRKQTSFVTRNVVKAVGVEAITAYFLHRLYKLAFSDYKRKQFFYKKPRLYFLRSRLNKESRVR